jgi:hypothetical protein
MKKRVCAMAAGVLVLGMAGVLFAQSVPGLSGATAQPAVGPPNLQGAAPLPAVLQIATDKAGFVAALVARWELAAKDIGKWDTNYTAQMTGALMKMDEDNLLAASQASSYRDLMRVIARGRQGLIVPDTAITASGVEPETIGETASDLVYTPLTPCRIVDTRIAGGAISSTYRGFDADGTDFSSQGGKATGCGVPYGIPRAVAATITITNTVNEGYITAWQWGVTMPASSVANYVTGTTVANTTILPITPGSGVDFNVLSSQTAQVIIDVVGYFAAPEFTPLSCLTVTENVSAVYSTWVYSTPTCATGYTVTGGGHYSAYPDTWVAYSSPSGNGWYVAIQNLHSAAAYNVTGYARCCRIPGR